MKWKGKKAHFLKKENTKPLFWIICHIFVAYDWHECLSQFQTVTIFFLLCCHTHTHTMRLLMFYSSPLMPSSEIDLFLNRNLFTFFKPTCTHSISPTHVHHGNLQGKKICNNFWNIATFCVCRMERFAHSSVSLFKLSPGINLCIIFVCFCCIRYTIKSIYVCIYDSEQNINTIPNVIAIIDEMKWYWQQCRETTGTEAQWKMCCLFIDVEKLHDAYFLQYPCVYASLA